MILEKCKEIKVDGITSIASELAMLTVSEIAKELNLPANSVQSAVLTQNKFKMKEAFEASHIPCAKGDVFSNIKEASIFASELLRNSSVIIKPSDRSGSLAINHIDSFGQLKSAFTMAIISSFNKSVVIEEFLPGKEYSIETISYEGKHKIIAFTEKMTTGSPFFVEVGHFQPTLLDHNAKSIIAEVIIKALDSLQITNGISHSEIKIDNGQVKVIEIGGRMGG